MPFEPYLLNVSITGPQTGFRNIYIPTPITVSNNGTEDAVGLLYITMQSRIVGRNYRNLSLIDHTQSSIVDSAYQYLFSHSLDTALLNYEVQDSSHSFAPFSSFIIPNLPARSQYVTELYQICGIDGHSQQGAKVFPLLSSVVLAGLAPTYDSKYYLGEFVRNAIEKTFAISIDNSTWNTCITPVYNNFINEVVQKANSNLSKSLLPLPPCIVYMLTSMSANGCINGLPATLTNQQIKSVILKTVTNLALLDDINSITAHYNH